MDQKKLRRILAVVALVLLAVVFVRRHWFESGAAAQAPGPAAAGTVATPGATASAAKPATGAAPAASASAAAPVQPAPPEKVTIGRLTLTACELKRPFSAATTAAFCAKFPVPENRADPDSRTIELNLAIIKSASAVPAPDLVVYLAGGPGQSAIETWPELEPALSPLLKHHDVLLLDQRGTGGSHPLTCPAVQKQMQELEQASPSIEQRVALVAACAKEVVKHSDPRFYTTTDAVADLEAVRQALGAPKLDLVGVSYGTRMAQHYAGAHPDAVRSIVLNGVVPNQLILGETFAQTLQRSLELQAKACSAAPACNKAFGDWHATLLQFRDQLEAEPPQQVTFPDPYTFKPVTRTLTADTLAGVVRMFSYSAGTAALLPLAVHEAANGNYAPLMGQSKLLSTGLSESMQGGMQLSVVCTEDASLLTPRPQDADTILGTQLTDALIAECKEWPHGPMPAGFHDPFQSPIPTLLISGERDPVTPPAFAEEVLKGLSHGRSLVVAGLGHAEPINAGCMPTLVEQFIDKLQPKQLDAECLKRLGPIPAFVTFNGAAP